MSLPETEQGAEAPSVNLSLVEDTLPERHPWRTVAKVFGYGVLSVGAGVTSMSVVSTEVDLGPHTAEVTLDANPNATADLGPIGKVIFPLEDTHGLGVNAVIKDAEELPADTEAAVERYARAFTTLDDDVEEAKNRLLVRGALSTAVAAGVLTAFEMGRQHYKELREKAGSPLKPHYGRRLATLALTTAVACDYGAAVQEEKAESFPISHTFDNTILKDARVTSRPLQELINGPGAAAYERYLENREFYETASKDFQDAYHSSLVITPGPHKKVAVFSTDIHLNVGMMEMVGTVVDQFGADILLEGGDLTMSGTGAEATVAARILGGAINDDVAAVAVPGNHDSREVEDELAKQGIEVLNDGEIHEVGNLTALGDRDPRRSEAGVPIHQTGDRSVEDLNQDLAETACAEPDGVDIVLVHSPTAGQAVADRGCAELVLSGHTHDENVELSPSGTLEVTGESAGGVVSDEITVDRPKEPAVLYVFELDATTGEPRFFQTVTVNPDASVQISPLHYVLDLPRQGQE